MIDEIRDMIKHYLEDHKKAVIIIGVVLVPVVASVLVGTFTGVRYIVNLTDTINQNELRLTNLERDVGVLEKNNTDINTRLSSAEATWQMAENLYRQLADQVRENSYDIKDLNREINY